MTQIYCARANGSVGTMVLYDTSRMAAIPVQKESRINKGKFRH